MTLGLANHIQVKSRAKSSLICSYGSSAAAVKPGGHIALMSESFLDEKETGRFLFINRDCTVLFEKAGLKGVQEISVNFTSGIKSFRDVQYAKQKGILLDLKRDLLVFKRSK